MFLSHNGIKLKIDNRKISGKLWIFEIGYQTPTYTKIKNKIKINVELNENEHIKLYKNF